MMGRLALALVLAVSIQAAAGIAQPIKVEATSNFAGGTGLFNDPYLISTAEELDQVRNYLDAGLYFKLTSNIDLGVSPYGDGWLPIGNAVTPFKGSFDGDHYSITGLYIDGAGIGDIGLFGVNEGDIRNVKLLNLDVADGTSAGGVAGTNYGSIYNSYAEGRVISSSQAGLLVGINEGGIIANSFVNGNASGSNVGKVAGYNTGTIENSYAAAGYSEGSNNIGGLVGVNEGVVRSSYARGHTSAVNLAGGLVGLNDGGSVIDSYSLGTVFAVITAGNLVGRSINDGVILNSHYNINITEATPGWDFDFHWSIDSGINEGYPYLQTIKYRLKYDGNGSTGGTAPKTELYKAGQEVVLSDGADLIRTGYTFAGWNTEADGSGIYYPIGSSYMIGMFDDILYAVWTPSYMIETLQDQTLSSLRVGYAAGSQETKTIALTRIGAGDLYQLSVSLSGSDAVHFEFTQPVVSVLDSATPSTTFTIRAKDALERGTYTATVTVSADQMADETFTITQVVYAQTPPVVYIPDIPTIPNIVFQQGSADTGAILQVKSNIQTLEDGTTYQHVQIDPSYMTRALSSLKGKHAGAKTVTVEVNGEAQLITVNLPIEPIQIGGWDPLGTIIIKTHTAIYALPINLLQQWTVKEEGVISIVINQVRDERLKQAMDTAAAYKLQLLLDYLIEFKLTVGNKEITDFNGEYVERSFQIAGSVHSMNATAVRYEPIADRFQFAASIFRELAEDKTEIVIKSPQNSLYTLVQLKKTYDDISTHWAKSDIELLSSKLIVEGKSDISFVPDTFITRAEFTALLVRSLGLLVNERESSFIDIQSKDWFVGEVEAAYQAGLVKGYLEGVFQPNKEITREEMAVILAAAINFAGKPTRIETDYSRMDPFVDADQIHDWAVEAVAIMVEAGIMKGRTNKTFAPALAATRAEAAVMLSRLLKYIEFINE